MRLGAEYYVAPSIELPNSRLLMFHLFLDMAFGNNMVEQSNVPAVVLILCYRANKTRPLVWFRPTFPLIPTAWWHRYAQCDAGTHVGGCGAGRAISKRRTNRSLQTRS